MPFAATGRLRRPLTAVAVALTAVVAVATAAAAGDDRQPTQVPAAAVDVATAPYDLGLRRLPQPGATGRFRQMPVRLRGVIAAPATGGPHPVVVVAHGAHGDGCPGEYAEWPCYATSQRNDLGLRGLARSLAGAGFVVLVPDLNGAYTGGYGEPRETLRFRQIFDASLLALGAAGAGGDNGFAVPLAGRVDLGRVGVIGHSRGGMNVERWAAGRAAVRSALLVAPFLDDSVPLVDVPTTLMLGTCDGDTRYSGARYITAGRSAGTLSSPSWRLIVRRANHNAYNQTLVRLGIDDASPNPPATAADCRPARRPTGTQQQTLLAGVARDHFTHTLLGATPAAWQDAAAPRPSTLHGVRVTAARYPAG